MPDGREADRRQLSELIDLIDELESEGREAEAEEAWREAHAIVMGLAMDKEER